MQSFKTFNIVIIALLLISIFSFASTTLVENTSDISYETLLDENSEGDDKEEEIEKEFFTLFEISQEYTLSTLTQKPLLKTTVTTLTDTDPHFRPPIFS